MAANPFRREDWETVEAWSEAHNAARTQRFDELASQYGPAVRGLLSEIILNFAHDCDACQAFAHRCSDQLAQMSDREPWIRLLASHWELDTERLFDEYDAHLVGCGSSAPSAWDEFVSRYEDLTRALPEEFITLVVIDALALAVADSGMLE